MQPKHRRMRKMVSNRQIKNRCPECQNWNGIACKSGIAGQFKCDLWSYDYARLAPEMLGTEPVVDPLHGEDITKHHAKLYGRN